MYEASDIHQVLCERPELVTTIADPPEYTQLVVEFAIRNVASTVDLVGIGL